jgi:hypothetical protein
MPLLDSGASKWGSIALMAPFMTFSGRAASGFEDLGLQPQRIQAADQAVSPGFETGSLRMYSPCGVYTIPSSLKKFMTWGCILIHMQIVTLELPTDEMSDNDLATRK